MTYSTASHLQCTPSNAYAARLLRDRVLLVVEAFESVTQIVHRVSIEEVLERVRGVCRLNYAQRNQLLNIRPRPLFYFYTVSNRESLSVCGVLKGWGPTTYASLSSWWSMPYSLFEVCV